MGFSASCLRMCVVRRPYYLVWVWVLIWVCCLVSGVLVDAWFCYFVIEFVVDVLVLRWLLVVNSYLLVWVWF